MKGRHDKVWYRIKSKYPNAKIVNSSFTATLDEYDRVVVKMKRSGAKSYPSFNSDGEMKDKLPKTIKRKSWSYYRTNSR